MMYVYLVLNDYGDKLGRAWTEADEAQTDRETVVRDLLSGQHSNPVRVVAFNAAEGWSRDVTEDIASELAALLARDDCDTLPYLQGGVAAGTVAVAAAC